MDLLLQGFTNLVVAVIGGLLVIYLDQAIRKFFKKFKKTKR